MKSEERVADWLDPCSCARIGPEERPCSTCGIIAEMKAAVAEERERIARYVERLFPNSWFKVGSEVANKIRESGGNP